MSPSRPDDPTGRDDDWGPVPDDDASETWDPGDRVDQAVDTLQTAARELIRSARTVLDLAEGVVDDPDAVLGLFGQFTSFAREATRPHGVRDAGGRGTGGDFGAADGPDDPDDVEHIPVD